MSNNSIHFDNPVRIESGESEVKRYSLEEHVEGLNEPQDVKEKYDEAYEQIIFGGSHYTGNTNFYY